ncbi:MULTISPECIES: hypothetical protein [unclassified Streptomyces]|uniref:hypothetical protein n=1 Tax=unclassified Streptomyces TaxID=2593676 RepID=UPI00081F595E|nr:MULTISPECIES: hypothetical protein [unclassified Streptomyces]MYR93067.1 hypothetical protein [Streptomyces sp. SID4937]SCD45928.1 hypothetical protein GA0115243_102147 [Streptomyces sp. ScaeMP-e83]
MAALLRLPGGPAEASEIVEALLVAAQARDTTAPKLAARWRQIADDIGDALDQLPVPKTTQEPT